ncbi:helix-turn-helix transcriptional regulator [Gemmata sp. JC717]|uniref:helix-turn-helix transcriptional regulator n=1 Tax=Gemmata algarum TaxID=2975278 RepID=UPI0021BB4C13|nr:helix-turn-helix domain-containing protein [Gemmata algarum]MDY3555708.1 helix-turn-helix transcriptional regulator [Gemmata algarum]
MDDSHPSGADFYDPRTGGQALRVRGVRIEGGAHEPARTNCFAIYRIDSGSGTVAAGDAHHPFGPASLLFFVPYQYVRFSADQPVSGEVIEFHANFLCVETFHAEVGCSGALFNDPYGVPLVALDDGAAAEVSGLFSRIRREQTERGLAHVEASLAYLKVLLIFSTRLKTGGGAGCETATAHRHPVLSRLAVLIEHNYRTWHAPARYADALHVTSKVLGRLVREHLNTTLTDLIRSRVLTHAKWQLLHTLRPVKEIAQEVGFGDELYFSRLFKKATGVSPRYFRDFETAVRGGSNLSMSSGRASILQPAGRADHSVVGADALGGTGGGGAEGSTRRHDNEPAETV